MNLGKERKIFKKFTFKDVMERLNDCIKTSVYEKRDNWKLCSLSKKDQESLTTLDLV